MDNVERVRDYLSAAPQERYFTEKIASGWRLVSVDWERDASGAPAPGAPTEGVPFGLEVADDCRGLRENALEKLALIRMMEMIVKDTPLDQVAAELNRNGYRTRSGAPWNPASIFDMLPRLVEAGPKILVDTEYVARRHG